MSLDKELKRIEDKIKQTEKGFYKYITGPKTFNKLKYDFETLFERELNSDMSFSNDVIGIGKVKKYWEGERSEENILVTIINVPKHNFEIHTGNCISIRITKLKNIKKFFIVTKSVHDGHFHFSMFGFINWLKNKFREDWERDEYEYDGRIDKDEIKKDLWFSHYFEERNSFRLDDSFLTKFENVLSEFVKLIDNEIDKYSKSILDLGNLKTSFIKSFDKNNNGELDLIEGLDLFQKLLTKNKEKINSLNPSFSRELIKVSEFLNYRKQILNKVYKTILDSEQEMEFVSVEKLFKNHIHFYNVFLISSLNMVNFLYEDNFIDYNKVHSEFEKLGIFETTWEKKVLKELESISDTLSEVLSQLKTLNFKFSETVNTLIKTSQENTKQLKIELESIKSGVGLNNLISGIQSYQLYKINKNTKFLR